MDVEIFKTRLTEIHNTPSSHLKGIDRIEELNNI